MDAHFVMRGILIFTISADKSIAGVVENVEKPVVKGEPGAENGGQNNLVGGYIHGGNA